ncbi:hypothetical protein O7634_18650 [Micromonospora sp. WMMD1120]|uniref:hypothetical protein n=1 Tax=Micromonospora sp. WMMD1120 TaxID=3016106 RepID=UPI002416F456|nr:hypothetical protein [Micromonospora sp. WMMD1120]MDG4808768.1 hypothetical protein [Micromonospora sp. WMMD1120]
MPELTVDYITSLDGYGAAEGWPDVALQVVDSRTFDGRLQLLEFVPTALTGPPGSSATS